MNDLSVIVNIPLKLEAEKLKAVEKYKEAAEKYKEAAIFAKNELKNDLLFKRFIVDENLCLCSISNEINRNRIKNLLNSIDSLININYDDRNYGLNVIRSFYNSILQYLDQNIIELESQKELLKQSSFSEHIYLQTISVFIAEIGILKYKLNKGNMDKSSFNATLKSLTTNLKTTISNDNIPIKLKNTLSFVSAMITDEKKKI